MFYFTFVFLFVSIFLLVQDQASQSTKYLIYTMTAFMVALFAMMFYLSKDTYYYNIVYNYFSLPPSIWKIMMSVKVNREYLILLMNFSSLSVLYFGICFAFSFRPSLKFISAGAAKAVLSVLLALEFLLYMPQLERALYLHFYPAYVTYAQVQTVVSALHTITALLNASIIAFSIFLLAVCYKNASPLRLIRLNIFAVSFCYALIMISYLFIFGPLPRVLIKVSKLAGITTFLSIPLNLNTLINQLFPYYLIITFLLIGYSLYSFTNVIHKINEQTFSLSKEIAASDTTSKVFCHYMKNELLAIQSEVELLELTEKESEAQHNIIQRCENLYNRLDSIHKSTKTSELCLTKVNLYEYIEEVLSHLSAELKSFHVELHTTLPSLSVMLDTNYFEQALHNILTNALDSMRPLPAERHHLTIMIQPLNNYAVIMIQDTGVGIPPENLHRIFEPFYSSQPVAKHWGMGLSLTHKIIAAHEGYIEADSTPDLGTTMKIMLPRLVYPGS